MKNKSVTKNPFIRVILPTAFWLALWQVISMAVNSEVIVASPLNTVRHLVSLASKPMFWGCCANSLSRILLGFALAVLFATALSAASARFMIIGALVSPIMRLIKATPVASFIVLALLWLKSGVSWFIAFLMVLPLVYTNLSEGISHVDNELKEVAVIYHFSRLRKLRLIYIPSLMPYFASACSVGLGFAWKAGIAAEVIGLPKNSLGLEIYNAKVYIETADLFALTAVIIILSLLIEKFFVFCLNKLSQKVTGGEKI